MVEGKKQNKNNQTTKPSIFLVSGLCPAWEGQLLGCREPEEQPSSANLENKQFLDTEVLMVMSGTVGPKGSQSLCWATEEQVCCSKGGLGRDSASEQGPRRMLWLERWTWRKQERGVET